MLRSGYSLLAERVQQQLLGDGAAKLCFQHRLVNNVPAISINPFTGQYLTGGGNTGDTTAPTAPANLTVTSKTDTGVSLTWSASTDNVGVTGYIVYRGTQQVSTVGELQLLLVDLLQAQPIRLQ